MRNVLVSMMGTLDGNVCGAHGEKYVLELPSNTIQMKQNGGNRR